MHACVTEEVGRQLGKVVLRQVDCLYILQCIFLTVGQSIALVMMTGENEFGIISINRRVMFEEHRTHNVPEAAL